MTRIRETIGWLLYQLSRLGFWWYPRYCMNWPSCLVYGYGRLDHNTGEFQFPVRCIED